MLFNAFIDWCLFGPSPRGGVTRMCPVNEVVESRTWGPSMLSGDVVIVDVETKKLANEVPRGWQDKHLMGLACAATYEYLSDRYKLWGPNDRVDLMARLEHADYVGGWNIYGFDYHVIAESEIPFRVWLSKTLDPFRWLLWGMQIDPDDLAQLDRFFAEHGHGKFGLDAVARQTLGRGKIGKGVDAPAWFRAGEFAKLYTYCLDDVQLEKAVLDFALKYEYLILGDGTRVNLKVG